MDAFLKHRGRMDNVDHLELIDNLGPGRRVLIKRCTHALTFERSQNIVPHFFANVTEHFAEIMQ